MIFARPQMPMGWGRPMQQIPQAGMPMQPGALPMGQQLGQPQLSPELLARLQQMQGLGGYGQMQTPQMGLGRPGIQPLSPASAYSFR